MTKKCESKKKIPFFVESGMKKITSLRFVFPAYKPDLADVWNTEDEKYEPFSFLQHSKWSLIYHLKYG